MFYFIFNHWLNFLLNIYFGVVLPPYSGILVNSDNFYCYIEKNKSKCNSNSFKNGTFKSSIEITYKKIYSERM